MARAFDRWASLDPLGVMPRVVRAARVVPGVELAERGLDELERRALLGLRRRLDQIALPAPTATAPERRAEAPPAPDPAPARASVVPPPTGDELVRSRLDELLEHAVNDSTAQSRDQLHAAIVRALVPDEARILSALAGGRRFALLHVAEPSGRIVLENASSVGRAAGVALVDRVPLYVTRLRNMDLVVEGPEDLALKDDYPVILTEAPVQEARRRAAGRRPAKILRRTLAISPLGREIWQAGR
ncbi:hypothetical protein SK069_18790 [Patulibacter brassicae]|uniref:DUF4393 domain-containing protein n=1 Tax=Patulibacter brassicae TaxID=1705717 RepID=A0ABU4VP72_9ACTN|nr:hypothetical protein [Patulibacter brassicae]MDX8153652.1 hypothetical protein [Patulibacter brassicae]